KDRRSTVGVVVLLAAVLAASIVASALRGNVPSTTQAREPTRSEPVDASYSDLLRGARDGTVSAVTLDAGTGKATVEYRGGMQADVVVPLQDTALLRQRAATGAHVTVRGRPPGAKDDGGGGSWLGALLAPLILLALLFGVAALARRRAKNGGAGMFGMPDTSLRRSTRVDAVPRERFRDVAGCDEAVEELAEIVDFMRDPRRFQRVRSRMPSGILLQGDPGTGKPLRGKALAGEAGVPFYATSGSDFVEKFVGVGASRVRELFERARAHEHGAVVFIDEIDAVGRARSAGEANG